MYSSKLSRAFQDVTNQSINQFKSSFNESIVHQYLEVSTLNYGGLLFSPFEFYSQDSHETQQKISQIFKTLLLSEQNADIKKFKWNVGKIDIKVQKERYTPIYMQKAGLENGKLINQNEFKQKWREYFELANKKLKFQVTEQEKKNAECFDLLCYKSIIKYLYGANNFSSISQYPPLKYQQFMKKYFSQPFLDEHKKIQLVLRAIQNSKIDVYFFQQVTDLFLDALKDKQQFQCFKGGEASLIVLRKSKFTNFHNNNQTWLSLLPQEFRNGLNWNQDTVFCSADNFIFICFHLSSKKQKNQIQVNKLVNDIRTLKLSLPNRHIIAGGDANSFLAPQKFSRIFNVFPTSKDQKTTMKKRTCLQVQANKADELSAQVKDSIISTITLKNPKVGTLSNVQSKTIKYIPNNLHPCDHFLVSAKIRLE